ncbi:AAA family ATPase [Yinghuangia soli]|uniref:AAA family ATPase n=1 Tax=Yinghuangia soli TaxID=2908204 RepID=A0AA41Q4K7_9ACTN|nr:AAA family ATPase [Yinghuangia soli]MCF2530870.1 AAA family ATPase [Yinghuangia soli]
MTGNGSEPGEVSEPGAAFEDGAASEPGEVSAEASGADGWRLFHGDGQQRRVDFPEAPSWRRFTPLADAEPEPPRYLIGPAEADVVNAALLLRRPLLVTGAPGTGKSSLAHAIAHELDLGRVLHWPINSRSSLQESLYRYDAVGRLREANLRREGEQPRDGEQQATELGIGSYVRLGPLGTALAPHARPRVLLVDELDKGDVDLPNDLLTVFEEGRFEIPELVRLPEAESLVDVLTDDPGKQVTVERGRVCCTEFPVVVITSNAERQFPPAFLRRCVRLDLPEPGDEGLRDIVEAHLGAAALRDIDGLMQIFLDRREEGGLATDQLLNAVFLRKAGVDLDADGLLEAVLHKLTGKV